MSRIEKESPRLKPPSPDLVLLFPPGTDVLYQRRLGKVLGWEEVNGGMLGLNAILSGESLPPDVKDTHVIVEFSDFLGKPRCLCPITELSLAPSL